MQGREVVGVLENNSHEYGGGECCPAVELEDDRRHELSSNRKNLESETKFERPKEFHFRVDL